MDAVSARNRQVTWGKVFLTIPFHPYSMRTPQQRKWLVGDHTRKEGEASHLAAAIEHISQDTKTFLQGDQFTVIGNLASREEPFSLLTKSHLT